VKSYPAASRNAAIPPLRTLGGTGFEPDAHSAPRDLATRRLASALLAATTLLAACGETRTTREADRTVTQGLDASERYIESQPGPPSPPDSGAIADKTRPIAVVDGRPITFDAIRPALIEAGGGAVLEEAVLDELLQREAERRELKITRAQIEAERELLAQTLTGSGAAADPTEAGRLLAQVRAARGLGDVRFNALLRRNATLRALVAADVRITDSALDQAYAMSFGARFRARLITTAAAADATKLAQEVRAGADFSSLAAERSTDASAARGGLLEPISPLDPAYPAAIRSTLRSLKPGEVSDPIALDSGFAILQLIEEVPAPQAAPDREAALPELERRVRTEQERLLMNQLVRRLLDSARVSITDRNLERAWRARTKRE
jgi:foldase protein PrsA